MPTVEEVKQKILAAGLASVDHHDCGFCGVMVKYIIRDGQVFFNANCNCVTYWSESQPRTWDELVNWMQQQNLLSEL